MNFNNIEVGMKLETSEEILVQDSNKVIYKKGLAVEVLDKEPKHEQILVVSSGDKRWVYANQLKEVEMSELISGKEAFSRWVVTHPDNLKITNYEEGIMFDAWQAAKAQAVPEWFVLVLKEPTQKMIDKFPEVFYQDTYAGECSLWVDDETIRNGYKAMIEAQEPVDD